MAKAPGWNGSDAEGRKPGERRGLDTPVVLAVNDARWVLRRPRAGAVPEGKPLSGPPGEYGRKAET